MIRTALVVLIATAACSELDNIDSRVCGNGVLDPTEDCDATLANDPRCVACAITCITVEGQPPPECPPGYGCGADQICHAPGGAFFKSVDVPFPVSDYVVSDVNQDGAGDVIGLTTTSVSVRLGAADDPLANEYSTLTPFGRGRAAFTLLDEDNSADVVLPTDDGLIAFSSPFKVLAPHAFAFNPGGGGDMDMGPPGPIVVFSLDPSHVAFLRQSTPGAPGVSLSMIDVRRGNSSPIPFEVAVCSSFELGEDIQFATYQLATSPDVNLVVVLHDGMGGYCAFSVGIPDPAPTPPTPPFSAATLLQNTYLSTLRPVLADFTGTGCPSLVVASGKEHRSSGTSPACGLAAAVTDLPASIATDDPIGRVKLVPAVAGGYGPDALVTDRGVFAIKTDRADISVLYTSDRPLMAVASGDINNDGTLDAVAIADDAGVDVLFRAPLSAFLLYRIATSGALTNIATGDYDGNFADDIVFTEQLDLGERLLVAYGTRDRPLEPIQVGMFKNITSFLPVQIEDSLDVNGLIADLAVLDEPGPTQFLLTILHGSPQRTMVSYFDPRIQPGGGNSGSRMTGVLGGNFYQPPGSPVDHRDVLAFEWAEDPNPHARLYTNFGTGRGALGQLGIEDAMGIDAIYFELTGAVLDGGLDPVAADSKFWLAGARYLAVPTAGFDRLISVDRSPTPTAIVLDVASLLPSTTAMTVPVDNDLDFASGLEPTDKTPNKFVIHSLRTADLDGNNVVDVLAAYTAEGGGGEVRVCMNLDFTNCTSLTATTADFTMASCLDAAPARAVIRGPLETVTDERTPIVALCDRGNARGLFRLDYADGGFRAVLLTGVPRTIDKVEIGDVNGDAIDDILALDRTPNSVFDVLRVYLQCNSRDVKCLTDNAPRPVEAPPQ